MIKNLINITNKVTSFFKSAVRIAKSVVAVCAVGAIATAALATKLVEIDKDDTEEALEEGDELPNSLRI